jgi:hypothetical protein
MPLDPLMDSGGHTLPFWPAAPTSRTVRQGSPAALSAKGGASSTTGGGLSHAGFGGGRRSRGPRMMLLTRMPSCARCCALEVALLVRPWQRAWQDAAGAADSVLNAPGELGDEIKHVEDA